MAILKHRTAKYLDPQTLDKIKKTGCVAPGWSWKVSSRGNTAAPTTGLPIEFATHREYAPGDDLRHIDWKVWSKTDRLYIKEYEEETNLKCHLLVDCSKSMRYGETTGWSKFDYAATAAASLAYMMQQQQDSVGLVLFSNKIDKTLKANSHPSHLKLIFHELGTKPNRMMRPMSAIRFLRWLRRFDNAGWSVCFPICFSIRMSWGNRSASFGCEDMKWLCFM